MQTSSVDGATRARTCLSLFALMYFKPEQRIMLDALIQMEETNNVASAEFLGVSAKTLESVLQLGAKAVQSSLDHLAKMQLLQVTIPPKKTEQDIEATRRRRAKRAKLKRKQQKQVSSTTADDEEEDSEDERRREEDGEDSEKTVSSDTEDEDEDEDREARAKKEEEEIESKATKYAVEYRRAMKVATTYFRKSFAALSTITVSLSEPTPEAVEAAAQGKGEVIQWFPFQSGKKVSSKTAKAATTATGLLCFGCTKAVPVDKLEACCRCPTCHTDVVEATLVRAWKFHKGELAAGLQTLLPECFRADPALIVQGLSFTALLQDCLVGLQEEPTPLTVAEEVMTKLEVQKAVLESHSTLALKYKPLASVPVQLVTIQEKEEAMHKRIENKIFRQGQQPPWLMSNSNSGGGGSKKPEGQPEHHRHAPKKHAPPTPKKTKRNRDDPKSEPPAESDDEEADAPIGRHLLPYSITAQEEEEWESVQFPE